MSRRRRKSNGYRRKQSLRWDILRGMLSAVLSPSKGHQFFEQDAFVCCMLIHQIQAIGSLGNEIRRADLANQAEEGDGRGEIRDWRLRAWRFAGRGGSW